MLGPAEPAPGVKNSGKAVTAKTTRVDLPPLGPRRPPFASAGDVATGSQVNNDSLSRLKGVVVHESHGIDPGVLSMAVASMVSDGVQAADAPKDRVVVMYFHRTQRCPTCQKMGSYTEEAVQGGFAGDVQAGKVAFHFINFQDERRPFHPVLRRQRPDVIVAKPPATRWWSIKTSKRCGQVARQDGLCRLRAGSRAQLPEVSPAVPRFNFSVQLNLEP